MGIVPGNPRVFRSMSGIWRRWESNPRTVPSDREGTQ